MAGEGKVAGSHGPERKGNYRSRRQSSGLQTRSSPFLHFLTVASAHKSRTLETLVRALTPWLPVKITWRTAVSAMADGCCLKCRIHPFTSWLHETCKWSIRLGRLLRIAASVVPPGSLAVTYRSCSGCRAVHLAHLLRPTYPAKGVFARCQSRAGSSGPAGVVHLAVPP